MVGTKLLVLITVVCAIILTITHPQVDNTLAIVALEVLRPTSSIAILFIGLISAVSVFIAHPGSAVTHNRSYILNGKVHFYTDHLSCMTIEAGIADHKYSANAVTCYSCTYAWL